MSVSYTHLDVYKRQLKLIALLMSTLESIDWLHFFLLLTPNELKYSGLLKLYSSLKNFEIEQYLSTNLVIMIPFPFKLYPAIIF